MSVVESATSAAPRDITEDYESLQVIGKGSFGTVYKATRKLDRAQVVVKEVFITSLNEAEQRCALQEASTLSKLQHDNIIRYHETRSAEGKLFIVMELAAGGDLSTVIKKRAKQQRHFSEDQIMLLFVQICLALWHVHTHNFMHRDLKSQNIFLCDNNVAKLGDFGIARSMKHTQDMANTAVGTPYYLSPEICEDKPYNAMSDVWGLGCILYEMTTLKRAFEGNSLPALVTKILRGRFSPIPSRYSMHLRSLIHSMLARNPNRRPTVKAILNLPWMRRHLDRYAAHMQQISQLPTNAPKETAGERTNAAGAKNLSMLRAQSCTTATRIRTASVSLDRATASSQQRQVQPQCKRAVSMTRHPQSARIRSESLIPSSRTSTPPSANKAERPPWQTPTSRAKRASIDSASISRRKVLDRSPAVGPRSCADKQQQRCRQSKESMESHSSERVRSATPPNVSFTRWPRQLECATPSRMQVIRERVSAIRSKSERAARPQPNLGCRSQHTENTKPNLCSGSRHVFDAQATAQQQSPQQTHAHCPDGAGYAQRQEQHQMPTIPAGKPADQQPGDDAMSLSSLSSISSHPVLAEPPVLGPVPSSFWVPPPLMSGRSPPESPSLDSARLPPVPAFFFSHLASPKAVVSPQQWPHSPQPSTVPPAAHKQCDSAHHGPDRASIQPHCASERDRQLRSAHAQARDARKAESNASGHRLVSTTWLAGNFAALDVMQGNLAVASATSPKAEASSLSVLQQRSTPRSPGECADGVESHAISSPAQQLSTQESDIDVRGSDILPVPSLQLISQEPSEAGVRATNDGDVHEAGLCEKFAISPSGCADEVRDGQAVHCQDGFDDIMLPRSPTRCPSRQAMTSKYSSPTKPSSWSNSQATAPVRRTLSLARRTQRQTPERSPPTHRRERTRPTNAQQRAAVWQQMRESQQAHRSALQHIQPRLCRGEIRRAGKEFAARVRDVKPTSPAPASPDACHPSARAPHEVFVIPLTPRGQRPQSPEACSVSNCEGTGNDLPQRVEQTPQRRLWVAPPRGGDNSALEMNSDWKSASVRVSPVAASHVQASGSDAPLKPWRQTSALQNTCRSLREPVVEIYVPASTALQSPGAEAADRLAEEHKGSLAACAQHADVQHSTASSMQADHDGVSMGDAQGTAFHRYSTHSTPPEIFEGSQHGGSGHCGAASDGGHLAHYQGQEHAQHSDRTVHRCQESVPLANGWSLPGSPEALPREDTRSDDAVCRITALRDSLQDRLGSERFLAAYRVVQSHQCGRSLDGQAERAAQAELDALLAPDTHLAYSIYRLLTLEELACGELK